MKHLTFFLLFFISTTSVFAQAFNKPFALSYSINFSQNNKNKAYFLRVYKKGDSVRTVVVDSSTNGVFFYDGYKSLKTGSTCWINHYNRTKMVIDDMQIPPDSSEWKVNNLGAETIKDLYCEKVNKQNQYYSITFSSFPTDQFDLNSLINHVFVIPFNSINENIKALDGFIVDCSIENTKTKEVLKIKLDEFTTIPGLPDSVFNISKFNKYPRIILNTSNIHKVKDLKNSVEVQTEILDPYAYQLDIAKSNYEIASQNRAMYSQQVDQNLNTTNLNDMAASINKLSNNMQLQQAEFEAYRKYNEVKKLSNDTKKLNEKNWQNPTYITPIPILNNTLELFYFGSKQQQKELFHCLTN